MTLLAAVCLLVLGRRRPAAIMASLFDPDAPQKPRHNIDLQKQISLLAVDMGWQFLHVRNGAPGLEDKTGPQLILAGYGKLLYIYILQNQPQLSSAKEKTISALRAAGAEVHVWSSDMWDEIDDVLLLSERRRQGIT